MSSSRVGPFALEDKLPGASCTYRAFHAEQRVVVAVKIFPAPFGSTAAVQRAFMDECAMLKMLHHRYIARCFGGGWHREFAYLAHELVEGESLRRVLERRQRLPWEMVVQQLRMAAEALEFLHERQVYHLALQPDKWILTPSDSIKLLDVRPGRLSGTALISPAARAPEAMRYWAPEQFSGAVEAPGLADMYALGCIAFEMLAGKPPFDQTDPTQLAVAHTEQLVARITSVVLDCPVWLDAVVRQLLEKDPLRRIRGPRALLIALDEAERHIAQGTTVAEHAVRSLSPLRTPGDTRQAGSLLRPKAQRRTRRSERSLVLWERRWFLALAVAIVVGLTLYLARPLSEEQLFRRAERLMASGEPGALVRARDEYLLPLLRRFPEGQFAPQARQLLDRIAMDQTESRLRIKLRLGRPLESEAERLLAEVWKYQQFGDAVTAAEKLRAIIQVLPDDAEHRPYRLLAERELNALQHQTPMTLGEFLEERLAEAQRLVQEGKLLEAMATWLAIVELYEGRAELAEYVAEARHALRAPLVTDNGTQLDQSSQPSDARQSPP